MKKFTFKVEVITESNATKAAHTVLEDVVHSCLTNMKYGLVNQKVRCTECKDLTEQGYKVWRGRVKGVSQADVS